MQGWWSQQIGYSSEGSSKSCITLRVQNLTSIVSLFPPKEGGNVFTSRRAMSVGANTKLSTDFDEYLIAPSFLPEK